MSVPQHLNVGVKVDAMYFEAATTAYTQAEHFRSLIENREGGLQWLHQWEAYDWGDEYDPDEEDFEKMAKAEGQLLEAFGRFLQSIALTHTLCAMALEAHINFTAKEQLGGKALDAFDKLSLEGKWLLLPGIVGNKTMDPGAKAYEDFVELVRKRNALVHPKKGNLQSLLTKTSDPNEALGSSLKDAERSLNATKEMAAKLAGLLSMNVPEWAEEGRGDKFYYISINQQEENEAA